MAAILAADVAGYSRLMGEEEGMCPALQAIRRELGDLKIAEHRVSALRISGRRGGPPKIT